LLYLLADTALYVISIATRMQYFLILVILFNTFLKNTDALLIQLYHRIHGSCAGLPFFCRRLDYLLAIRIVGVQRCKVCLFGGGRATYSGHFRCRAWYIDDDGEAVAEILGTPGSLGWE